MSSTQTTEQKLAEYPSTDLFRIKDTIGVPHPYCIGPKHVAHAADHFRGRLGDDAIRDAEKKGITKCQVKGCNLSYDEHEKALLVEVNSDEDLNILGAPDGPLHKYLLSIKDRCEADGFAGFAFIKKEPTTSGS